jgi:hypothetical protein
MTGAWSSGTQTPATACRRWAGTQIGEIKKKNSNFLTLHSDWWDFFLFFSILWFSRGRSGCSCWLIASQTQGALCCMGFRRYSRQWKQRQDDQALEHQHGSVCVGPPRALRVNFSQAFPALFQNNSFCACWLTWMISATSIPWRSAPTRSR